MSINGFLPATLMGPCDIDFTEVLECHGVFTSTQKIHTTERDILNAHYLPPRQSNKKTATVQDER